MKNCLGAKYCFPSAFTDSSLLAEEGIGRALGHRGRGVFPEMPLQPALGHSASWHHRAFVLSLIPNMS